MTRRALRAFFCVVAALGFFVLAMTTDRTPFSVLLVSGLAALVGVVGVTVYGGPGYRG